MKSVEVFEAVKNVAEKIKCDDTQSFPEAASIGDFWRQGDLYVTLLDKVPENYVECPVELKLVSGTSQGSRHILSHGDVVMYKNPNANVLEGPIFSTKEEVTIEHPDHGDLKLPGDRIFGIRYQQAYAEVLRAVRD